LKIFPVFLENELMKNLMACLMGGGAGGTIEEDRGGSSTAQLLENISHQVCIFCVQ
jgi:hypothetical protein